MPATTTGSPTSYHCSRCGDDGHSDPNCWSSQRVCFNCHEIGHCSTKCPRPRGILKRICGGCKEKGHIASECPTRSEWVCANCAEKGHGHWECPKPRGYLKRKCAYWGGLGHLADDCTNVAGWKCKNCNEIGHLYETCQNTRGFLKRACRECGQTGHVASDCPRRLCYRCGGIGHASFSCTNPVSKAMCHRCDSQGHLTKDCPVFKPSPFSPQPPREHSQGCACVSCMNTRARASGGKGASPMEAMRLWRHAMVALAADEHANAMSLLNEAISIDQTRSVFYTTRGALHLRAGAPADALSDFQYAFRCAGYAPTAEVLVQTARCRLHMGSRGAALLAVREALTIDPADEAARTLKRRLAEIQEAEEAYRSARAGGRSRAARTAWETCVSLYEEEGCAVPVEVKCWGVALAVAERTWEDARSTVEKLLAEEPRAIDVMLAKITVEFLTGDLQEALAQAKAALKLDPDNTALKSLRSRIRDVSRFKAQADVNHILRDYAAALAKWERALELVPDGLEDGGGGHLRAGLLFKKAQSELKLKRYAEALKTTDASLKLDTVYWRTYLIRGRINVGLELFDLAVEDLRTCLQHATSETSGASSSDVSSLKRELRWTERLAAKAKNSLKDYYQILDLKPTCTQAEIRKAYCVQSLKHHPDKGGAEEKFKLVNEAYSTLSDPDARRDYDAKRAGQY